MKLSQKSKAQQYDSVNRERNLFMKALQVALRDEITWYHTTPTVEGCKYRYGVSGLLDADGGIIFQQFICTPTGQRDTFEVWYFDDLVSRWQAEAATCSRFYLDLAEPIRLAQKLRDEACQVEKSAQAGWELRRWQITPEGRAATFEASAQAMANSLEANPDPAVMVPPRVQEILEEKAQNLGPRLLSTLA